MQYSLEVAGVQIEILPAASSVCVHTGQLHPSSVRDGRTNGRDAVEASGGVSIETDRGVPAP